MNPGGADLLAGPGRAAARPNRAGVLCPPVIGERINDGAHGVTRPTWFMISMRDLRIIEAFHGPFGTGDWKVAGTRRLESLRYSQDCAAGFHGR